MLRTYREMCPVRYWTNKPKDWFYAWNRNHILWLPYYIEGRTYRLRHIGWYQFWLLTNH